jgi:hypothetical protein
MRAVFRPMFGRVMAGAIGVLCLAALGLALKDDGARALWQVGPWLALVAGAVWATYWRPEVAVDDGGVHVVNVLRTVDLPWPSIQRVDTKWALKLVTAYGSFTAWAAPAPGGLATARAASRGTLRGLPESTYGPGQSVRPGDVPTSPSGAAAGEVRRRWEALRDAGHLNDPRLEFAHPPVHWHWPVIIGGPVLILIGVLGLLFA